MLLAAPATGNATFDFASYIIQFGVVGLLLLDVGVTRKVFVPRWTLDNEKEERERERAALQERVDAQSAIITELTDHFVKDVVPALTLATDVNRQYVERLQNR